METTLIFKRYQLFPPSGKRADLTVLVDEVGSARAPAYGTYDKGNVNLTPPRIWEAFGKRLCFFTPRGKRASRAHTFVVSSRALFGQGESCWSQLFF